jgi:hypothetical protein
VVSTGGLPASTIGGGSILLGGSRSNSSTRSSGSRVSSRGGSGSSLRGSSSGSRSGNSRSSSSRGSRGGSSSGSGLGSTDLGGNAGPGLGDSRDRGSGSCNGSRGGSSLLLSGDLLLLGSRGRLGSLGLLLLQSLGLDNGHRGLINLFDGGTVGLRGNLLGLLGLAIDLLQLLINLGGNGLIGDLSLLDSRGSLNDLSRLSDRRGNLLGDALILLNLLDEVAEDVVENVVAIGLLSQNESLGELARGLGLVGDLANDGDEDVVEGGLGVDVQNANLAVLEVKGLDLIIDSLRRRNSR